MSDIRNTLNGPVTGQAIQIAAMHGSIGGAAGPGVVRLLPYVTAAFTNRSAELAGLDAWADRADAPGGSSVCVITGPAGIGKTALALHWINANRHRFTHAQVAVDCGGGAGEGTGRSIGDVCDAYFRLAGFDTDGLDLSTETAKVDLFTSLISAGPVVILLDDVQTAAQVRAFLSNRPDLLIIVTSTAHVPRLGEAVPEKLPLEPIAESAVVALFHRVLGAERAEAEPEQFARLVELCAGVPLIAAQAACLLDDLPLLPVGELVRRMAETGRLAALDDGMGDDGFRPSAVFDVSYAELSPAAAAQYRALGLHPTPDFDQWAAAALSGPDGTIDAVAPALGELLRRGLVHSDPLGRYVMDGLVHEHALLMAERHTAAADRVSARVRLADYYLFGVIAADRHISQRWRISELYGTVSPFDHPDFGAAGEAERAERQRPFRQPTAHEWIGENLDAAIACTQRSGRMWDGAPPRPGYRWQMGEATNGFFTAHGRNDERATVLGLAEDDAEACGDNDALARILAQKGELLLGRNSLDEARTSFARSLAAAEAGTERRGQGAAHEWLGITERKAERPREALARFDLAQPLLDHRRPRSIALLRMHRGDAYVLLSAYDDALRCFAGARAKFAEHAEQHRPDHANMGKVLTGEAKALTALGRHREAGVVREEALTAFRQANRRHQQAKVLEEMAAAEGDRATRIERLREAAQLFDDISRPQAAQRVAAEIADLEATED